MGVKDEARLKVRRVLNISCISTNLLYAVVPANCS